MRPAEAQWVERTLAPLPVASLSPLIEFGASSKDFREVEKPHIERHVHGPLRARGVRIVTTDIKSGDGIDLSGDVFDPNFMEELRAVAPRAVMLSNILEHLPEPGRFAAACADLLPSGGYALVTVPYSYPYHLDPIDTMYRPDIDEAAALFPGFDVVAAEIVSDTTHWGDLRGRLSAGAAATHVVRSIAKSLAMRGGREASRARLHRLLWMHRPFRITAVLLAKCDSKETR